MVIRDYLSVTRYNQFR